MEQYLSAGEIATGVFAWLLPENYGGKQNTIDPEQVSVLLETDFLQNCEAQSIWCYAKTLSITDVELSKKAEILRQALKIDEDFQELFARGVAKTLNELGVNLTKDQIITNPPEKLTRAISSTILDYAFIKAPKRKQLNGLDSIIFQHPADRITLAALKAIPMFDRLVGKYIDLVARQEEVRLLSSAIEATEESAPMLCECLRNACSALDLKAVPPLYIEAGPLNAYTTGADQPYIVISSSAVNLLNREEMMFVLGHEIGHIMAGHVRYYQLAIFILNGGELAAQTIPIVGELVNAAGKGLTTPLLAWSRCSEYTADRAGLLACQNREAMLRVMMKMAGYPVAMYPEIRSSAFVRQTVKYQNALRTSSWERLNELSDVIFSGHPRLVDRAAKILNWVKDGYFDEIIDADSATLKQLAECIAEDPQEYRLSTLVIEEIADWATKEFKVSRKQAGKLLRAMVYRKQPPVNTALEPVLRIELAIKKETADRIVYNAVILLNRSGVLIRAMFQIKISEKWDETPNEIRKEMLKGNCNEISRLLYQIQGGASD